MNSNSNSKIYNNNQKLIETPLNKENNIPNNNEKENSINLANSKDNQSYLNELNNKDESIIKKKEDDLLLISFSNISELNKTNINKNNKLKSDEKNILTENSNILANYNNFQLTPVNDDKNYNINNTYNNDIKKENLNYIFNKLNSDKKSNSNFNNDINQENNFNFSSLNDISSIKFKNSDKKGKENNKKYIIENTKNINIINSNDKKNKDRITFEINNVNNIEIINDKKKNSEKIKNISNINNIKHLSNFSFGMNNINIVTNNGKQKYGNYFINFDENKLDNIIENNDEYFSPKFNVQNGLNEFKNINEIKKTKKKQFEISHIDSKDIINIKGNKEKDSKIITGYTNLQFGKGFPSFSIIDKKKKGIFKKININKIKLSQAKKLSNSKLNSKSNSMKKKIFPNEEELYIHSAINMNNGKKESKENNKNNRVNMTLDTKRSSRKNISNKIKNTNIFNENKNTPKRIDQNLKEKIQNILKKNFELILSNNISVDSNKKRNSNFRNKNSSDCSFNSNYSNSSFSNKKKKTNTNKKINSACLYKGKYNKRKLNSKDIFINNTFNKEMKYNNDSSTKNRLKKIKLKNEVSTKQKRKNNLLYNNHINYFDISKSLDEKKKNFKKNETNIVKFIKTKTRNGIKEEKTYIIENKDINVFNIDINKNNNTTYFYNTDSLDNGSNKKLVVNNGRYNENKNLINNIILNKYKKPIQMIQNFKNYQKKV